MRVTVHASFNVDLPDDYQSPGMKIQEGDGLSVEEALEMLRQLLIKDSNGFRDLKIRIDTDNRRIIPQ